MSIIWFVAKSLAEYLKLMEEGKLGKPGRPKECKCGERDCFWVHGSYRRWVEAFAERAEIEIYRLKCRFCGKTFSIMPCFVVPRCRYAMEVIAGGVEGYVTTKTSYRQEVVKLGIGPSPAQLFQWVKGLLGQAQVLTFDVQARCISWSIPEERLEKAEAAECPNSWKAQIPGKGKQLDGLAKLVAFSKVLFKAGEKVPVLKELGVQFLEDVNEMQQIFKSKGISKTTPQSVKP
jgi:hypothetical protein